MYTEADVLMCMFKGYLEDLSSFPPLSSQQSVFDRVKESLSTGK